MNTLPPNDFSFYELLDELVQSEPAAALDPEIAGHARSIGIVKGQDFDPDDRMRKILEEAVALGNATARTISTRARAEEGFAYYDDDPDSQLVQPAVRRRLQLDGSAAGDHAGRRQALSVHRRAGVQLADRLLLHRDRGLPVDVHAPDRHRLAVPNDVPRREGEVLDGRNHYRLTLPPDIPAERFWSITVYDNQTRSMLQTDQSYPRAGSQSFPSPAATAEEDGSTDDPLLARAPDGVDAGNWIQTVTGKGWFPILRCYSPKASFFDKSWRPGEVEPV